MKRLFSLMLILSLLLCGCGSQTPPETTAAPTEAPTTAPTEAPTEAPTAPTEAPTEAPTTAPTEPAPELFTNPLTGEANVLTPDSRPFAVTINNIPDALPHSGVSLADLYFEMFVNDYATRGLAVYYDIAEAPVIGSVRSMRMNFTDICQAYDAIAVYCGGSSKVLSDMYKSKIDHEFVESVNANYHFRDADRRANGYAWEHVLFVKGPELKQYMADKGVSVTASDKDYGLHFSETPASKDGEDAATVTIDMKYRSYITKTNILTYDPATGLYNYNQYGKDMVDPVTEKPVAFKNVIVMLAKVKNIDVYHVADLQTSGEGYFACDGKIIPILWNHESEDAPFTFTLTDGTPLEMGVGNSYISIAPTESNVAWE